ncbi:MAG: KR domain-containing protein, partial [Rhodospirillales bacterium]|nr:KR domain-containing protein [Rhodospirillales bacterium]
AGLVKAVLMLRHQAVPPTLHFERLNPHIDLGGVPVSVPTALVERDVRVVGVSSFGFSGTNAHVVLAAAPSVAAAPPAAGEGPVAAAPPAAAEAPVAAAPPVSWPGLSRPPTTLPHEAPAVVDGRPSPAMTQGAASAMIRGDAPATTQGDAPATTQGDAPAMTQGDAPAMTQGGAPVPPRNDPAAAARNDAPATPRDSNAPSPPRTGAAPPRLLISARTPDALRTLVVRYRALLAAGADFADLCHSAAIGRARLPWWVCVDSPEGLETAEPSDASPPDVGIPDGRRVDLPLYPFQRQPYWAHPKRTRPSPAGSHPLLGARLRSALRVRQHEAVIAPDAPAWLADHDVAGRIVVPAAALLEIMLAAAGLARPVVLGDVGFEAMLAPADHPVVQTTLDPATGRIEVAAAPDDADAPFTPIAAAHLAPAPDPSTALDPSARILPTSLRDLAALDAAADRPMEIATLYARFVAAGLAYGPAFRTLRTLRGGTGVAVAELAPADTAFHLDPRVLDAAWQSLAAALPPDGAAALVPVGLDRFAWFGGVPARSVLRLTAPDRADVALLDTADRPVAVCEGLRLVAIGLPASVLQETVWEPAPAGTETPAWIDCRAETNPVAACWRVLEAFRAAPAEASRLAVLAAGATSGPPSAAQAALVGLVATLARERPELRPVLLDLDAAAPPPPIPAESGPLLAMRDGALLAPRLAPRPPVQLPAAPFVLARGAAATLDALRWTPAEPRPLGPGEVEIEVTATGINFRDVMNLLGVYPGDGGAPGVECAGTITAIGPGVTDRRPGEAVVAIAPGSFASHVIADARLTCPVPIGLDWQAAAAQPVAMLTARLALAEVAGLRPGQRVLIHAATGGVGLAALALAQRIGATVVATAGSPAKRARLAALGVTEIHDSRSLDFAAAAPVDAVLNSLTGAAIPAGLRLLAPGGVFLELGKAELWTEAQVRAVRTDVRYEVVALDRVILEEPDRVGAMLRDALAALAAGEAPLPVRRHPFGAAVEALRDIQAARHVGKLVLARARFRSDASYVVSGGTGALGRHLARFLRARGAGQVVLLARRAAEVPDATVLPVDVADPAAVADALAGISPPIKGVFHLAAALHDATAIRLTQADLDAAFAAKLRGAEALDRATAALPLDHFVLFGSLAGVVGSAGQANYAAANAALDALVRRRRAEGRPALLLDWGAWQGEGMAQALSGPALSPAAALAALDVALSSDLARVAVSAAAAPTRVEVPDLAARLAAAVGTAKRAVLAETVDAIVGRILGLGDLGLERARPLTELGLDSLMAVELRNALGAAIGRSLPTSLVFDHPTAAALADALAAELGLVAMPPAIPDPAPVPPAPIAAVPEDDLDDDAALALLERKLSHAGY